MSGPEAVKVIIRCRPMNQREKGLKSKVRYFYKENILLSFFKSGLFCQHLSDNDDGKMPHIKEGRM